MTTDLRPMFGAHRLQPEGLKAVYGGRWIVQQDGYTDLVPDRHGVEGASGRLLTWLNYSSENGRSEGALQMARDKASELLKSYILRTNKPSPIVLYHDKQGAIVADTNGSCGYLYVTGWLFDDLPEGHPTKGLEKVTDAIHEAAGL